MNPTISRVNGLPDAVTECCGQRMKIRRSSLRDEPCADDVLLKCTNCYRVQTHGIPITRQEYETEMAERGRRIVDMVDRDPRTNLEALGYIDY